MLRNLVQTPVLLLALALACGPTGQSGSDGGGTTDGGTDGGTQASCTTPTELTNDDVRSGGVLAAGTCWTVNEALGVEDGILDIQEGVVLTFAQGTRLSVSGSGRLHAVGTASAPVVFTGATKTRGFWKGVGFDDTMSPDNVLDHVVIEYAGGSAWTGDDRSVGALYVHGQTMLSVTDSTLRHNASSAFGIYEDVELTFTGNTIQDNASAGWVQPDPAGAIAPDNVFDGNDEQYVKLSPWDGTLTGDATWADIGVPWRVMRGVGIEAKLTLAEGAVFEFGQDVSWWVEAEGAVTAEGTAAMPITLRGAEDLRGYWKGIAFRTASASNRFDHVVLESGGSKTWTGNTDSAAMIRVEDGGRLALSNSTLRKSGHYAFWAGRGAAIEGFMANTFEDNARAAFIDPDLVGNVDADTTVSGNDEDVIRVGEGTVAHEQTWVDPGVPYLMTRGVEATAPLHLDPGTHLVFDQDEALYVTDGALDAQGTAARPVILGGAEDLAGYWKGIDIRSRTSMNDFTNVIVENAGSKPFTGNQDTVTSIFVRDGGTLSLTDVTIRKGKGYAIYVADGSVDPCSGLTLDVAKGPYFTESNGSLSCPAP